MEIRTDLGPNDYDALGDLLYDAFGRKLSVAIDSRETALRIIRDGVDHRMGFYAFDDDGDLVGVVGVVTRSESFYAVRFPSVRSHYPLAEANWRYLL